ncbi:MAG: signal peptidase II [Sphingomonadales bacterium]|jgi:signal peptidase II|nr:signal peptidase II [Sphingomonadales bacterium]
MGNPRTLAFALAALIAGVDQFLKYWVLAAFNLDYQGAQHELLPFFQFTLTHNEGIALGLFQAGSAAARWALTGMLSLVTVGVTYWLWTEKNRNDALGLGLILGGAIGNLVDRARLGYVIDYADLHFGDFRPFLIFNLADAAITIGVLMLLARALFVRDDSPETETK